LFGLRERGRTHCRETDGKGPSAGRWRRDLMYLLDERDFIETVYGSVI